MDNRQFFALILLAVLIGLGVQVVRPFWAPLAWAGIIAYVASPVYRKILLLLKGRASLAATIATLLAIVLLLAPISILALRLPRELAESYRELSGAFDEPIAVPRSLARIPIIGPDLDEWLTNFLNDPEIRKQQLKNWFEPLSGELGSLVGRLGRSVAQIVVGIVVLFFFFRDGEAAVLQSREALRKIIGEKADKYFLAVGDTTRAVVLGLMVSALAQGVVAGLGYQMVGVGAPILLGALTVLTAVVPFLGAVLIWAPVGVGLILADQMTPGLVLLAWGAFIVNPIDNILKPLLISGAIDVPISAVLIGVMGGLMAFGLIGLFLGPLVLSILLAIWREWLAEDHGQSAVS
jgi:predicted PurR-regulated permease PerM